MDTKFASRLLKRIGSVDPAGCCGTDLDHPFPPYRNQRSVEIGYVIEHRFAFCYWLRCKQELLRGTDSLEENFRPPDLITWDWHDDVGGECDYFEEDLIALDQTDEQEVALFCWAGLRQNNDGHVAPALWLNALGNVYVLQKQRAEDRCEQESGSFRDRYEHEHQIWYFREPGELANHFAESNSGTGVIWDIDLDFFTQAELVTDQKYAPPISPETIRNLLDSRQDWMQQILRNLRAITIALEPEYSGGLSQSLCLYSAWEQALFSGQVFSNDCRWRDDLFQD